MKENKEIKNYFLLAPTKDPEKEKKYMNFFYLNTWMEILILENDFFILEAIGTRQIEIFKLIILHMRKVKLITEKIITEERVKTVKENNKTIVNRWVVQRAPHTY
ncbi:MAG: hypothetical protein AABY22_33950 [Nanoarchaeota archaeon]